MSQAVFRLAALLFTASGVAAWESTPLSGYEVAWTIDGSRLTLKLRVNTTGWVGFGFSGDSTFPGSGGMEGADIVRVTGDGYIEDAHNLDENWPLTDCRQDW